MLATERFVKRLLSEPEIKENPGAIIMLNLFLAIGKDLSTIDKRLKDIDRRQEKIERGLRRR